MAIWQSDLFVISPAAALPKLAGDGWDIPPLLVYHASEVEVYLRGWLGTPCALLESTLTFGDENGDRVDFSRYEEGYELHVRLDAREPNQAFSRALCRLLSSIGCVLFAPESGSVVVPEPAALLEVLAKSRASRFCRSPGAFLEDLRDAG